MKKEKATQVVVTCWAPAKEKRGVRTYWTPARDAQLRAFLTDGKTTSAIAKEMGIPYESVKVRARRFRARAIFPAPVAVIAPFDAPDGELWLSPGHRAADQRSFELLRR